jgi:hypothetical protein
MKTAKLFLFPLCRAKSRRDGTLLTVCFSLRTFSLREILLSALLLFFCAGLRAQVTIGGLTEPAAGTVLDLNSTAKGGLILSNVLLGNLLEIPASFPGAGAANPADLKAGLTGAMIYNTNPAFCTGVHVWNGQHWGRITAETPVYTPGTLSITSNTDDLFGDTEVEFTAASGAKIYRWYVSINSEPYKYLGITDTPVFSDRFPTGNCKVKVIMDDCRSLKESNEVTFAPEAISPDFGSLAGGNIIYIYGDFPYAATSEYEQGGLVAHFDGINNRGSGDKQHDYSATSWKDLKSGFELPRYENGDGRWLSNGFQALDEKYSFYTKDTYPSAYPIGDRARTVEVIFRTPETMFAQGYNEQHVVFMLGKDAERQAFAMTYRGIEVTDLGMPDDACSPTNKWTFQAIGGNSNNLVTCLSSTPSLETANTINTVTSTYANSIADEQYTNSYINNTKATVVVRGNYPLNTTQDVLYIGNNLNGSTFLSFRLYDRVLEPGEIAENAVLDQKRYLAPPTVTIGGNLCTEVVVLSPHILMCKVPAGSSEGTKDVEVNGVTYSGAYKYVPVNKFYVSNISPIIGGIETILRLKGNEMTEINEVLLDGKTCTLVSRDAGEYKCSLPSDLSSAGGEMDITIKLNDDTVYRFAKVFEYLP